jgi:multiple sugar transport system ATP-binding protein
LTGINGIEQRKPSELSGGQRQRVAVARALVRDDALVLLADECFSDLDAQLKFQLRGEFRSWQRDRGLTCIFVTHDQEEALALGDRIALMNMGRIDQIGTPDEVYERPGTLFAAGFLGRPAVNLIPLRGANGDLTALGRGLRAIHDCVNRQDVVLGVRPEDVQVLTDGISGIEAIVEWVEPLNPDTLIHLKVGDQRMIARARATVRLNAGARVQLKIEESRWHFFDGGTGVRVPPRV